MIGNCLNTLSRDYIIGRGKNYRYDARKGSGVAGSSLERVMGKRSQFRNFPYIQFSCIIFPVHADESCK
jgi:hypothetical protein